MDASRESVIETNSVAHPNPQPDSQSVAQPGLTSPLDSADPTQLAQGLGLYVIPVDQVVTHERYNGERVQGLMARIAAEDRLINPPVVVAYGGRYVVLDGATRVTAFRRLGYPHIIVQVVDLHTHRVRLDTWQHTVHGGTPADLLAMLGSIEGLRITPMPVTKLLGRTPVRPVIGYLLTPGDRGYWLEMDATQIAEEQDGEQDREPGGDAWLALFNRLVDSCGAWGRIERTLSTDMDALAAHYPDLAGHFVYHGFEAQEVLALAASGHTVPAGITRFVIPGRILRLNAPLDRLLADEPAASKRAWLNDLVAAKIANRQMRYYEEPVILLDE
ncbi:MAG: hypothetical protein WDZ49_00585 [Litorilinea sp.]